MWKERDLLTMGRKQMERGRQGLRKSIICYTRVPTLHDECNQFIMQTYTIEIKL